MSEFSELVKRIVRATPKGSVTTYQSVACAAGSPKAYRAVASIMANNFDPAIPCHRVIRSNGTVGDYNRGGPAEKKRLLEAEGVVL